MGEVDFSALVACLVAVDGYSTIEASANADCNHRSIVVVDDHETEVTGILELTFHRRSFERTDHSLDIRIGRHCAYLGLVYCNFLA